MQCKDRTELPSALVDPAAHRKVVEVPEQMTPGTAVSTAPTIPASAIEPPLKRMKAGQSPKSDSGLGGKPLSEAGNTTASGFSALIDTSSAIDEGGAAWHMMLKRGDIASFKELINALKSEAKSDELAALLKDHAPLISTIEEKINSVLELEATAKLLPVWGKALRLQAVIDIEVGKRILTI